MREEIVAQHDSTEYLQVINLFLSGGMKTADFERRYLQMFKDDSTIRPDEEYEVLNALFSAVDAYCGDAALRDAYSLDEQQLRAEAQSASRSLTGLLGRG